MNCHKKRALFFLLFAVILICLSSCASSPAARRSGLYAWLTDDSKYMLLRPENIENPMDSHQLFSALYGNRSFLFIAWVKADSTGIDMTFMNELGTNMGELSFREGSVSYSTPMLPEFIGGEYIVADFQLCYYNAPALRKALESCGLSLDETGNVRRVYKGKNLVMEIEKNQNTVKLVNHYRGYTYTLEGGL